MPLFHWNSGQNCHIQCSGHGCDVTSYNVAALTHSCPLPSGSAAAAATQDRPTEDCGRGLWPGRPPARRYDLQHWQWAAWVQCGWWCWQWWVPLVIMTQSCSACDKSTWKQEVQAPFYTFWENIVVQKKNYIDWFQHHHCTFSITGIYPERQQLLQQILRFVTPAKFYCSLGMLVAVLKTISCVRVLIPVNDCWNKSVYLIDRWWIDGSMDQKF